MTHDTCHLLNSYGYEDLETLADFLIAQKQFAECVRVIKQGVRWMQGRDAETEWDTVEDDREFDPERKVRQGWDRGNQWLEREPVYELDVRLRARLGIARLWLSSTSTASGTDADANVDEAKRHFDLMLEEDVRDYPELFDAVGDAYFARAMYDKALEMFTVISECEEVSSFIVCLDALETDCLPDHVRFRRMEPWSGSRSDNATPLSERTRKLANVSRTVRTAFLLFPEQEDSPLKRCDSTVIEEEPTNIEVKVALARLFEKLGEPQRALALIKEGTLSSSILSNGRRG